GEEHPSHEYEASPPGHIVDRSHDDFRKPFMRDPVGAQHSMRESVTNRQRAMNDYPLPGRNMEICVRVPQNELRLRQRPYQGSEGDDERPRRQEAPRLHRSNLHFITARMNSSPIAALNLLVPEWRGRKT